MPIPKAVARVNLRLTNPILMPLARRLPGFAVVTHVGRRSGKAYRTPVNLFRHDVYHGQRILRGVSECAGHDGWR